ncbi:hypothetical protein EPH_0002080 [Eimeria praecox]|uniref:Uncharacterized protein n=1 Tax=Eimeria praecox TaxID=51316 RepID=U6G6R8_9EIME|nr:hypothetical protein EPH_0002080 [Eimeria praecox]
MSIMPTLTVAIKEEICFNASFNRLQESVRLLLELKESVSLYFVHASVCQALQGLKARVSTVKHTAGYPETLML